jgi:hypothetical protein
MKKKDLRIKYVYEKERTCAYSNEGGQANEASEVVRPPNVVTRTTLRMKKNLR